MSDLIAIAYPDEGTAAQARETLARLQRECLIELADAVVVKGRDGLVEADLAVPLVGAGVAGGALWGTLIGTLFFAPLLGMAVGGGRGASQEASGRVMSKPPKRRQTSSTSSIYF